MTDRYYRLLDDLADAVRADGLPREVRAVDQDGAESIHMLFRDGDVVRSCLLADWPAEQTVLAAKEAERTQAAVLRQQIRDRLAGLAGKRIDDLLVGDLKTLLLYLVWREGGIDRDLKVKPIDTWGR